MYARSLVLLALQLLLVHGERLFQELLLLLQVHGLDTDGNAGARATACVEDVAAVMVLGLVEEGLDTGLGEGPGAGVEGLLLAPDNVLGVAVAIEGLLELLPGERVELLDADDGGVLDALRLTVFYERGVDLAGAEDHAGDALGLVDGLAVLVLGDDPAEVRIASELFNGRAADLVTQEGFREEEDQGWKKINGQHDGNKIKTSGDTHVS